MWPRSNAMASRPRPTSTSAGASPRCLPCLSSLLLSHYNAKLCCAQGETLETAAIVLLSGSVEVEALGRALHVILVLKVILYVWRVCHVHAAALQGG